MAWGGGHHSDGPASSSSSSSGGNVGSQGRGPGMGNDPGREGSTVGSGTNQAQRSAMRGDPDKAKLSKDLVDKLDRQTLQALMEGGHGVSGGTYGGLSDDAQANVDAAVDNMAADQEAQAQKSRMAVMSYLMRTVPPSMHQFDPAYSMQALTPQQQAAFESQGYNLSNLGYTPGQGLMNLAQQPTVRDMTTGEILGYPSEGLTGYLGMAADF